MMESILKYYHSIIKLMNFFLLRQCYIIQTYCITTVIFNMSGNNGNTAAERIKLLGLFMVCCSNLIMFFKFPFNVQWLKCE